MTEDHSQRAHARLAPSAASRWTKCPGSVQLSAGIEEPESVFAAEGTAAHMLAEKCLSAGVDAERYKGAMIGGFLVDAEMVDGVQTFLDMAREIAEESDEFDVEQRLDMTDFVEGVFGTGDVIAYREDCRRVTIADLKYGAGVPVDVANNAQLLTYALGVANRYHNRGVDEVELIICQPRAPHRDGPVRRWVTDVPTLYEHAIALQTAAAEAAKPDAPLNPGEHCRFCKAAGICPALHDAAMEIAGATITDGEVMSLAPIEKYDPETLAKKFKALPLLKNYVKRLDEFVAREAAAGRVLPGYKQVQKQGNRRWVSEATAVERLRLIGLDDDVIYESKVRSPAQLEKELPKAERGVINQLSDRPFTGTELVPIDDSRPAINLASGFEAVSIEERK